MTFSIRSPSPCPGILARGALNDDDKVLVPFSRSGGTAAGGIAGHRIPGPAILIQHNHE